MYAITGITGHVGGAAARALLAAGEQVRAVVRDPAQGESWRRAGAAEVAVADLTDPAALATALAGCRGAFVLLPTIATGTDADHRRLADTIAAGVAGSGVLHVVALSSYGADLPDGTGPVRWLHHLENGLRGTGAVVTAIRSPHFQEKAGDVLPAVLAEGVYPVFGESADVPVPMAATRDVGAAVAASLADPPLASEVVDLDAPQYTERQVAEALAGLLGRHVEVAVLPRPAWTDALLGAGLPPELAAELVALYDATGRGLLVPRGDRAHRCTTPIETTLRDLVAAPLPAGRP
ncbi:NAD-dependent epimerase/dehydratase family protein [Jiangella ureilytica]|uniref:NAD-dependent epimerase/dehydratase family protein n=1 Tax=Jiangella ureilytica TaxID=2530374 RepID=A0A4R4RMR0_9ACTN|nr:NAD(P)H-binding protein [Jiangella ureilytica]TDC50724.1 NAD-dependent epimerase/dehydratase family protein [Jiangella ureilytica]